MMGVGQAIAAADRLAFSWQPDAVLAGIYVKAAADGTLDLDHLAGKADPAGDLLSFYYVSAKANRKATIGLDRESHAILVGAPVALSAGERVLPVGGPFLDLERALAKVRQMGIALPASRRTATSRPAWRPSPIGPAVPTAMSGRSAGST